MIRILVAFCCVLAVALVFRPEWPILAAMALVAVLALAHLAAAFVRKHTKRQEIVVIATLTSDLATDRAALAALRDEHARVVKERDELKEDVGRLSSNKAPPAKVYQAMR